MWGIIFTAITEFVKSFFRKDPEVTRLQKEVKDVKSEATEMAKPTPAWDDITKRL